MSPTRLAYLLNLKALLAIYPSITGCSFGLNATSSLDGPRSRSCRCISHIYVCHCSVVFEVEGLFICWCDATLGIIRMRWYD